MMNKIIGWKAPTVLLLAFAVIAGICGGRTLIAKGVVGSEDNILFYMMGLNLVASERLADLADKAIDYYGQRTDNAHTLLRLNLRKTYLNEFPAPGMIYLAVSRAFKGGFEQSPALYPLFLAQSLIAGFVAAIVASLVIAAGVIGSLSRRIFVLAFAVTVLAFGLTEYLPVQGASFATILVHDRISDVLAHTGTLLSRPGPQFSMLGFTPRSHFAALMIAVFALRWSGRYGLSYLMLFALSFVHLSTAALMVVTLIVVDLLIRPKMLAKPIPATVVVAGMVVIGARLTMWQILGGYAETIGVGVIIVLALTGAAAVVPAMRERLRIWAAPLTRVRDWFAKPDRASSDLKVLSFGWIVTALLLFAILKIFKPFDDLSTFYFWGRVHGRVLMALWPSLVFGVLLLGLYHLARKRRIRRYLQFTVVIGIVGLSGLVAVPAVRSLMEINVTARMAGDFLKVEERMYKGPIPNLPPMGFEERVLYYAIAKSIDTGKDHLPLIFR